MGKHGGPKHNQGKGCGKVLYIPALAAVIILIRSGRSSGNLRGRKAPGSGP